MSYFTEVIVVIAAVLFMIESTRSAWELKHD